jgi:branched-chain amino acid aminotransferase
VKIWLGSTSAGALHTEAEARISALDHGLTVGDGVFETLKAEAGTVFAVTRHLERLARSASGLGLPAPDPAVIREAIAATVAANDAHDFARVRVTYTGGPSPLGSERAAAGDPTLIVAVSPVPRPAPATSAVTVPWTRNERSATAGLKTTSYAENVVALARAKAAGATEALFADTTGRLSEGTGTNVFVVIDGEIKTPALTAGCLPGITRALVLDWTTQPALPLTEADLPFSILDRADEIFLTSTLRDVQAVVQLNGRKIGGGVIGPVTTAVRALFHERSKATPDPAPAPRLPRLQHQQPPTNKQQAAGSAHLTCTHPAADEMPAQLPANKWASSASMS